MVQNKTLTYLAHPSEKIIPGEHIGIKENTFDVDQAPPAGGITVKIHYVSFDPYQRGRMRPSHIKSYSPAFELNSAITNGSIATVLKSDNEKFKAGDQIVSLFATPTAEYAALPKAIADGARVIQNPYNLDTKLFLGPLGMPGLTAYSSFYDIGLPKKGETIFISSAAGPVGQLVGQLAKHEGLTVIGSVGEDKKLDFIIKELGFDGGFNYKKEKPIDALKRLAPNGIDIYYENVGGEQLEAAITCMNDFGRIVACGMISQYNLKPENQYPIKNLMQVVAKRLTMRGFIVGDANMGPRYAVEHQQKVQKWLSEGTFKAAMDVTEGIDNASEGLVGLFEGKNFGKAVLEVSKL